MAAVPFSTNQLDLLPAYDSNKNVLTFFTTLVSLLGVAILFAIRRRIGISVFPHRRVLTPGEMYIRRVGGIFIPAGLIGISILSLIIYLGVLNASIDRAAQQFARDESGATLYELLEDRDDVEASLFGLIDNSEARVIGHARTSERQRRQRSVSFLSEKGIELIRQNTPSVEIPLHWPLEIFYVIMFLSAVLAFVWFGIIEYMQGELGLDYVDRKLLENPYRPVPVRIFEVPQVRDLKQYPSTVFFRLTYNPDDSPPTLVTGPEGPYCDSHKARLGSAKSNVHGTTHLWSHNVFSNKKLITRSSSNSIPMRSNA